MEWKGRRERIYQNAITAYSQGGRSEISNFRVRNSHYKRVIWKLAKLEAATGGAI